LEILLTILYSAVFIYIIYRASFFRATGLSFKLISGIFLLKVLAGVSLSLIYSYYYTDRQTADIFKYFDDSKYMFEALSTNPGDYFQMLFGIGNDTEHFNQYYVEMNNWFRVYESNIYNDSHTIIRFNALLRIFSFGYYNVHTVFMCFISLVGLMAIYKAFTPFVERNKKLLVLAVFFIPSIMLWGSGVLKEGLLIFGLGMLIYSFFKCVEGKVSVVRIAIILLAIFLLFYVKFYVLMALIPVLAAYWWTAKTGNKLSWVKYGSTILLCAIMGLNLHHIMPKYHLLNMLAHKQKDFINLAEGGVYLMTDSTQIYIPDNERSLLIPAGEKKYKIAPGSSYTYWNLTDRSRDSLTHNNHTDTASYAVLFDNPKSGSKFDVTPLKPTVGSFLANTPEALGNTFLRPYFFESKSPFILLAGLENLVILLFGVLAIVFIKPLKRINTNLFLLCLSYAFILFTLIGWVTPVMGAIVRYKVPALPFLAIAFILLIDTKKLTSRVPLFKKLLD
jgi:hypothetical protein